MKLGDYTLKLSYGTPGFGGRGGPGGGFGGFGGFGVGPTVTNVSPARLVIHSDPGEYVFVGGPMTVTFTPNRPEDGNVVLGSFDEVMLVDGRWVSGRRLNGDETDHSRRWPAMRSFGIYRYRVYQRQ